MFGDRCHVAQLAMVSLLLVVLGGCGAGVNAGEMVRPDAPTASDAISDTVACTGARSYAEPLVVDWSTSSRTDLEVAMKRGVAVVRYDCDELRLVNGCRLPANYVFAGVSLKEELIRMDNADEVQANLPVSGVKISAGMNAASVLDLALVMVGKRSTTLIEADRSMLEGSCEGATHFVRAATIGAFAMDRSSSGEVRAAADLFGAGADANSRSGRSNVTRDGDRDACRKGKSSDAASPLGCGAALRLELVPLAKAKKVGKSSAPQTAKSKPARGGLAVRNPQLECPVDTVWKDNKCARATADERLCFRGNMPACDALCDAGDGWACSVAGQHFADRLRGDVDAVLPKVEAAFDRGCKLQHEASCAYFVYYSLLNPKRSDLSTAAQRGEASCARGGDLSCSVTALIFRPKSSLRRNREITPAANETRYVDLMQRSCNLGLNRACERLARHFLNDESTKPRAMSLLERACEGGYGGACQSWAAVLSRAGKPAESAEARALACLHGTDGFNCEQAALLFHDAEGVPRNPDRALRLARRGCKQQNDRSCSFLVEHGSETDKHRALQRSCDPSRRGGWIDSQLCRDAANDSLKRAMELDRDACENGNAPACERHATRQLALACASTMGSSCLRLKARDPAAYREVVVRRCEEDRIAIRKGQLTVSDGGKSRWCLRAETESLMSP